MRSRAIWLAAAGVTFASPSVFSVHDDLLAFPQYEVVFTDSYILEDEAASRLDHQVSTSSASSQTASTASHETLSEPREPPSELSKNAVSGTGHSLNANSDTANSYESMILRGRPYLCSIPSVSTPVQNDSSKAKDKAEEAAELARATDRGWELLKDMEGNCMYFISGWWSYSFCYNTDVKQFHQLPPGKGAPMYPPAEDPATPSYVLGKFEKISSGLQSSKNKINKPRLDGPKDSTPPKSQNPKPSSSTQLRAKGDLRYLVQTLSGGTTCDLTGRDRKVEVQFHCHPQSADRIGWIKEVSTCSYLMVIYTPRLCNDVAFLPPRENKAHPISCQEVLASSSDIPSWRARRQEAAEKKMVSATPAGRPVVGGIEVGGMKQVGKEGQRIETPPNTAFTMPGQGGVKAETLAQQESREKGGKMTKKSDEELGKMGLDPAVVEGARRELAEVASGKGWKLEVFDVGDGARELRGVVDGDDEEEVGPIDEFDQGEDGGSRNLEGTGDEGDEEGDVEERSEEVYKDEL